MVGRIKQEPPKDFTLGLALVDMIPVVLFGVSMMLVAGRLRSPLFILGAAVITLAGCGKVLWKLILACWKKDIRWLNRYFIPCQIVGFVLALVGLVLCFGNIRWAALLEFPRLLFCLCWLAGLGVMGWYRKNRFDNSLAANWTAQIINTLTQTALLAAVLV